VNSLLISLIGIGVEKMSVRVTAMADAELGRDSIRASRTAGNEQVAEEGRHAVE